MDHRTITRKNNAGHLILSALLLCQPLILSAINPQREYSVPIEERGKNFEELQVETTDGSLHAQNSKISHQGFLCALNEEY